MNQKPTFSYKPFTTTPALCISGAISGATSTIPAFRAFLYQDFYDLYPFSFFGALGFATILPLMVVTLQKWKEQDRKEEFPCDVSKGWFSLAIAASTTAIANSVYYCATQVISNEVAIATSTLSGMVITACAMRMYMDRIRDNNALSLA